MRGRGRQQPAESGDREEQHGQRSQAELEGVGVAMVQGTEEDHADERDADRVSDLLRRVQRARGGAGGLGVEVGEDNRHQGRDQQPHPRADEDQGLSLLCGHALEVGERRCACRLPGR
jgi:hypothetical protein